MRWQCELLGVNRSSLNYEPRSSRMAMQLALMRRMDELGDRSIHCFGSRSLMTQILKAEGSAVNRSCEASHAVDGAREHCAQAEHKQASAGTLAVYPAIY